MAIELTVPQLGESITEAVVGKWHKRVGEPVSVDEPLVVLETDKVTIDVQAPQAGALSEISHPEGDRVKIGDVLGRIQAGAGAATAKAAEPAKAPAPPAPVPAPTQAPASDAYPRASPVARNMAEGAGIDLRDVKGTGPSGRVTKDDVRTAVEGRGHPEPAASKRTEERVKMTPLRRRVAERLLQAQSNAAILTTFNEVDMGEVMALRKRYAEKFQARHGVKLGFMSFFVRAAVEALKAFPQVNAEIDGEDVVFKHYYDIGVAVSGTRGLVVPVVRDADRLSMAQLEQGVADLAVKARNDKLALSDLQGGTFTITNGGIFGSMLSTPILNPPQVAILGMHNIVERPVVKDGQVVVRPVMYLALSYDHRLIDGREAVQFLVRIKDCIEDPERMLLEV
jgi:2-oxoglutarate dehydrogenase E2 component (dihydrolipoamide succinyltransferase)